jgi:sec-independent protein translocase protein TatB
MFDIGFSEIIIIVIIAVIFLGPDKLPDAMVKVARFFKDLKRVVNDARSTFEEEVKLKELKDEALHYRQSLQEATGGIEGFKNSIPNPVDELNSVIEGARRDMISMDDDGKKFIDDFDSELELSKKEQTQTRPTEFKNLKRGDA